MCRREWQQDPHASLCCRYEIFDYSTTIKFREGESRYQVKIDSSYRRCVYDVFTIWTCNAKDTYDVSCCEVVEEDVKLVSLDWSTVSRKHTMLTWCWFKSSRWECWDGMIRGMSWELSLAGQTSISFKCDNIKRRRSYQAQYYKKFECYSNE